MAWFKGWGALALVTAVSGCSFLTDIDVPDQEARCDDGRDDDLDGSADCSDEDCAGSSACPPPLVDVEVLVSRFLRREVFLSQVDVCVLDRPELGCEVADDTGRVRLSLPDGQELSLVLQGTGVMPVIQPIVPSRGAVISIQLALDFRDFLANSTFPGDPDDVAVGLVQLGPRVQCATRGWSVSFTGDATAEAVFYEAGVGDDTARRWTFTRQGAGRAYGVFDVDAADEVEARLTLEEASMGCIDPRCEGPLFPNRDWPPRGDEAARGPLRRGHVTLLASLECMDASP
ncbi:MAG TPA: hypothetical protein RMF84_09110 [Polyangiaceae bacterium LLY-WYZ-14_1]|nr:hypothetical protein [Polyangiaceae bacterium LLY-WYZ-14_1]